MACLLLLGAWHWALDAVIVLGIDTPPPSALSGLHHQVGQPCPKPGSHPGAPRVSSIPGWGCREQSKYIQLVCVSGSLFLFRQFSGWAGGGCSADTSFTTCCWLVFLFQGRRGCGYRINLRVFFFSPKKSLCCNAGRAWADDIFMGLPLVKTVVSARAIHRVG